MSFIDEVRKRMTEEPDAVQEPDEETMEFAKWAAEVNRDDIINDSFHPKIVWIDGKECPRLTLFPDGDGNDGDWVGMLPRPLAMITSTIDDVSRIAVITDSVGTTSTTKVDGTEWVHGEMQEAMRDKNNPNHHLMSETLMVLVVTADETCTNVMIGYTRNDDGTVTFEEPVGTAYKPAEDESHGRLPDAIRGALRQPKMSEAFKTLGVAREAFGLTETTAAAHQLCVSVKMVMSQYRWMGIMGASTEEEAEIIKHSMDGGPFSENIRAFDKEAVYELVQLQTAWNLTPDPEED